MQRSIWFIAGMFLILAGIFVTPASLAAVGIFDTSLASANPLVRQTALLEVRVFGWACLTLGLGVVLLAGIGPKLANSAAYTRFMARDMSYPPAYEWALIRGGIRAFWVIVGLTIAALIYIRFGPAVLSPEQLQFINREDGLLETGSALVLLLAAGVALRVSLRRGLPARLRNWHVVLGLLFFVMFGEEISWGQRLFGFDTPEAMRNINVQGEVNMHNMFGYFFDHAFILCFFIWGFVLPRAYVMSSEAQQVLRWIGLPLPSFGLCFGALLITLFQDQLVLKLVDNLAQVRLAEVRETLSAVLFLLLMRQSRKLLIFDSAPRSTSPAE